MVKPWLTMVQGRPYTMAWNMVDHGLYMVISWSTMFLKHGRPCLKHGQPCFDCVHFTGVGTQYAEILLYRTLTSICTLKRSNFHQKTQHTWHTKWNNSKKIARSRFFWVISAFINLNMDFGRSKSRKFNKQTHQS